jgi:hypothetical protein
MRDLEGHGKAGAHIGGAENRGHAAASSDTVYPVVIELFPGVNGILVSAGSAESGLAIPFTAICRAARDTWQRVRRCGRESVAG